MITVGSFSKASSKENVRTVGKQFQYVLIMLVISLLLFGGIGWRLAYLQLEQGKANRTKAESNRIRIVPKPPVRGNLFDRQGKVLATTRLSYSAYVWPRAQKEADWEEIRRLLAAILEMPAEEIQKRVEQAGYNYSSLIPIVPSLTPAQITAIEEYRHELKWVEVDVSKIRHYPHGKLAAHVLGYTGELDREELERKKKDGYRLGDLIGKMGVEATLEQQLRGEWGGLKLEVDGSGKVLRFLGEEPAKAGKNLTLTLDMEVQKAAEAALDQQRGAIVALDPNNGEVLAIASYPSFDPNIFSSRITPEIWKQLQARGNPFLNLALRGFPPASTFKVVTATAGMESGQYPPNTILGTSAALNVGGTLFREWNRAGFGSMGYVSALAWSSNTFHGQIGRGVGGENLIKWARLYGFGKKTGIELTGETSGLIADDAWKRENFNDWGWTVGDTVNMSIGQGFTLATPLQVAVMFAATANGGYQVKPHLLQIDNEQKQQERVNLNLKPETIDTLRKGLRAVVAGGTGGRLNVPELPPIAGKSGTAEAPPGESHAWFGAFAPFDKPEIVVVAFAEHSGGGGSSVAAPMVLEVMKAYFK
ncbi:penicillin-binding protein 2 [Pleurocapsales cyanobacterium LEGE 06147]|nr:penicillin-binding protein 2 [Pleurocapsales cyanobacterium LEGE 06147]